MVVKETTGAEHAHLTSDEDGARAAWLFHLGQCLAYMDPDAPIFNGADSLGPLAWTLLRVEMTSRVHKD